MSDEEYNLACELQEANLRIILLENAIDLTRQWWPQREEFNHGVHCCCNFCETNHILDEVESCL